jgi:hypothetical protein
MQWALLGAEHIIPIHLIGIKAEIGACPAVQWSNLPGTNNGTGLGSPAGAEINLPVDRSFHIAVAGIADLSAHGCTGGSAAQ